ncbi:hypothetical protein [Actinophytocola algeriensis]|uniref:SH3 domain-containing protein n=1 Tax=Actinophytocola algeriensis TaxID=1768010 RepID=A0A7W7VDX0_9PSEU|nr:hypothetical protein [Actinophytocola algeriensis]MBB4906539.1 hypothetical protein [Actinophytocola algeriensis]MBE1478020.1 hypothetical protein [Actinophytocola algeriensis]
MKLRIALLAALLVALLPGHADAAPADTISADRATVRDNPGRLVLANAAKGDRADVQGYCGEWVRVRVTPDHAMATTTGWVMRGHLTRASQSGGLDGVPERCGDDTERWRDWVGAINAPFRSLRLVDGKWRRITFGTGVHLAAGCVLSLNYTRVPDGPDRVDPAQAVPGLDMSKVSYRYVTTDGAVALVSAPRPGASYGVWGFVPSTCLLPKNREHVYFDEPVVQLQNTSGLHTGVGYSNETIRARGCSAALVSPTQPRFGYWVDPAAANRPPCPV